MAGQSKYSKDYEEWLRTAPRLPAMTREEFNKLFEGAEPATEDDVPWGFPVRTPLENADADSDSDSDSNAE